MACLAGSEAIGQCGDRMKAATSVRVKVFGPRAMSDVSPRCAPNRTSTEAAPSAGSQPAVVASWRAPAGQNRVDKGPGDYFRGRHARSGPWRPGFPVEG